MTERDDALDTLSDRAAAVHDPCLSAEQVANALDRSAIRDHYGNAPELPDGTANGAWNETYDINAAAADLWDIKAGMVAGDFDFKDASGQSFSRSQAYKHCKEQAAELRGRSAGTVKTGDTPSAVTNNRLPRQPFIVNN